MNQIGVFRAFYCPRHGALRALIFALILGVGAGVAEAAISLEDWGSGVQQSNTAVAASFTGTPTAGNLLIAVVGNRDASGSPTTPSGWTVARDDSGNTPGQIIYYKIAGASEPTTVTVSGYPAVVSLGIHLYEYSGVDASSPLAGVTLVSGSGTTASSGSVNTSRDGALVLVGFTAAAGTDYSGWTSGFVEEWDFANGGAPAGRATYAGADLVTGAAGAYSTSATLGASADWIGHVLVVNPPLPEYIVTNTNNTGDGSLRAAIDYANLNSGALVTFDIPDTDPGYQTSGSDRWWRIAPTSGFSPITAADITIDGTTQTNNRGNVNSLGPEIELYGADAGGGVNGLQLAGGGALVQGLVINSFLASGIELVSAANTVAGCFIGTNALGTLDLGNTTYGVEINNVGSNTVGGTTAAARNVISGNLDDGIIMWNTGATSNLIQGNYIGLNATGSGPVGNVSNGIKIGGGAHDNTVGGSTSEARNVLSGNEDGVQISENGAGNKIYGNYIGTDVTGTLAIPNLRHGVVLYNGANGTLVGGATAGQGNVISGNADTGIVIDGNGGAATTLNTIAGNLIGTDKDGAADIPNSSEGVHLFGGANVNTIGGTVPGARNVISGNAQSGVRLSDAGTTGNILQGNYVGLDATGTAALPNNWGILIDAGANSNIVGGSSANARNVLSGNTNDGIILNGNAVDNHVIIGNYIGTNAAGTAGVPNNNGVFIMGGASTNSVGGPLASDANLIAYNNYSGVSVLGASLGNAVLGNWLFNNAGLGLVGIDLGSDGQTANNGTKSASLPNFDMDYPVLTQVELSGTNLNVAGYVGTAPGQALFANARVEFFESFPDGSGYGQGISYLGFLTSDGSGNLAGTIDVNGKGIVLGDKITATATDSNGNTSEYGQDATVVAGSLHEIAGTVFEDADFAGTAADWDGGSGDVALANVDVELYDGADTYLASTTTAGDGSFSFTGLSDGSYKVRARSATVGDADTPPSTGVYGSVPATWPYPLPEMVWAYGADLIGGQDAGVDDTALGDNAGPGDTWIAVNISGGSVAGVNFGFSYELISNNADDANADNLRSRQGSLRQFIKNSNAIVGVNNSWFRNSGP